MRTPRAVALLICRLCHSSLRCTPLPTYSQGAECRPQRRQPHWGHHHCGGRPPVGEPHRAHDHRGGTHDRGARRPAGNHTGAHDHRGEPRPGRHDDAGNHTGRHDDRWGTTTGAALPGRPAADHDAPDHVDDARHWRHRRYHRSGQRPVQALRRHRAYTPSSMQRTAGSAATRCRRFKTCTTAPKTERPRAA